MSANKVFLVTGCSTGFGYEYIKNILKNGHSAVATSRNADKLPDFEGANDSNLLKVSLDVTSEDSVEKAFKAALDKFGHVDVVCNNAGFGLSGAFETVSDKQARQQMDINFFGLMNVTRVAVRTMRESGKGGLIQQVTSIGGQRGVPSFSIYCASKWAVEGFTEALSKEMKEEWKIKFTCIEPGGFRTEWSGGSMIFGEIKNPAYDHIPAEENAKKRDKTQGGDPAKAGEAFYKLAVMENPPLRVVLGSDAYSGMQEKLKTYSSEVSKYEELSKSTDVDE